MLYYYHALRRRHAGRGHLIVSNTVENGKHHNDGDVAVSHVYNDMSTGC